MLLYYLFWMFMGFILHIYIIFGTNLLTGGPARIAFFWLFQYFEEKEYQTESKWNETFGSDLVTPWIRCARCLSVIHRRCHVICLRVAFYHVIMCISFCIRVRLMHPSIFPVVHFAIRRSYVLRRPPFVSRCERVLNFLGMDRVLPSGLGIAPIDRL